MVLASGLGGLGALGLVSGDFALDWQPVPAWVPFRTALAYVSGAVLLGCGASLFLEATCVLGSAAFVVYALAWLLLLRIPPVLAAPTSVSAWLGWGENALLLAGAWTLWARLASGSHGAARLAVRGTGYARVLYGLALLPIGLSHFVFARGTASMVPTWLPARLGFAYLTGAGHAAAGIAIVVGVWPRLAAAAEAAMIATFVVLLHLPGVVGEPGSRLQWTMLFVATSLGGAAMSITASYWSTPWLAFGSPCTRSVGDLDGERKGRRQ